VHHDISRVITVGTLISRHMSTCNTLVYTRYYHRILNPIFRLYTSHCVFTCVLCSCSFV